MLFRSQAIRNLRAKNDFIEFSEPQYLLGNLETIKRDLITQATEDAQKRAVEFAKTGGGKVGAMRSMTTPLFIEKVLQAILVEYKMVIRM